MLKMISFAAVMVVMTAMVNPDVAHAASQKTADDVQQILNLVPAQAQAAVVIPNLKTLSDQITQTLEGMDRANLLFGARPIDQLKAATGLHVGVNDTGGLAMVLVDDSDDQPTWVYVIPVTDADAFLEGNLVRQDDGTYTLAMLPGGVPLHARSLNTHVVLATSAEAVRDFPVGDGLAPMLAFALDDRGEALVGGGEVIIFGRQGAFRHALSRLRQLTGERGMALPGAAFAGLPMTAHIDFVVTNLEFDALGVITRSFVRFLPQSPPGAMTPGAATAESLARLPNKPYYLASSIDLRALGGIENFNALAAALMPEEWPQLSADIHGVQFAAYPSPVGLRGGILNDAALIIQTSQPQQMMQAIQQHMLALQTRADGIKWQVKWEENKRVSERIATADAYEAAPIEGVPDALAFSFTALWQNLFGAADWRGFVHQTDDAVIMTFSQRPAVLEAALQAQTGGEAALRSNAAIRTMREMMPPKTAMEAYVGVSQIIALIQQVGATYGIPPAFGDVAPNLPPIGVGVAARQRGIETAVIIPADVLAIGFDSAMQQRGVAAEEDYVDD